MADLSASVDALAARIAEVVSAKADDSAVVHDTGTETIGGAKTFSVAPQVPVGALLANPVRRDDARLTDARTPTAHNHAAADITSGTISTNRLPPTLRGTVSTTTIDTAQLEINVETYWVYLCLDVDMGHNSGLAIPTGTPANHHSIMVAAYANGGSRDFVFSSSFRLSTGIPSRTLTVPSGQVLLAAVEYSTLISAWTIVAATVSSS